jgi:hypothetical protein
MADWTLNEAWTRASAEERDAFRREKWTEEWVDHFPAETAEVTRPADAVDGCRRLAIRIRREAEETSDFLLSPEDDETPDDLAAMTENAGNVMHIRLADKPRQLSSPLPPSTM